MADLSLTRKSACELAELIQVRSVSPVEVLEAHLAVIHRINPQLNAIVTLDEERAVASAKLAEVRLMAGQATGALFGLPVAIKDVTVTEGIRTTFGSPLYEDYVPDHDAEVVTRLKKAGAIILAKTNTPEFACGATTNNALFGPTRNPWQQDLSPGGSSGGSAAAVASGMVPLAQGTDFGGSVRVPASFCGIVGLRPTPGLTPNYPMPLAWDPGQVHGVLARTAEDAALMLDSIVGLSPLSPISVQPPWSQTLSTVQRVQSASGLRIAFVADLSGIGVEPEVEVVCRNAAMDLVDYGASVEEITFDVSDGRSAYSVWRGMWMVGQQHERMSHIQQFGSSLKTNVQLGLTITAEDVAEAEQTRQSIYHRFRCLFERFDLLLTPTVPVEPFRVELDHPTAVNGRQLDNYIDWVAQTFLVTLVSLPAGTAPAGRTAAGLPVGIQIIAPRFEEPLILSIAKLIQERSSIGWPDELFATTRYPV